RWSAPTASAKLSDRWPLAKCARPWPNSPTTRACLEFRRPCDFWAVKRSPRGLYRLKRSSPPTTSKISRIRPARRSEVIMTNSSQSAQIPKVDSPQKLLLQLKGIVKGFAGVQALKGVDFDVREGEVHALMGENGAGKSTLMKIMFGVQP